MNKFRARQLDASKPIAIYVEGQTPGVAEINNATNRTVPQLPTGMEKEEETEHHLQQAIFHQRVIPVPEVYDTTQSTNLLERYDQMYPANFQMSQGMVHIHPFEMDNDIPDYDIDSEDEAWLEEQKTKGGLIPLEAIQFEEMMDRLEKASGLKAITLQESKLLLKDDDDLITAVFDHWLNKRLRLQHPLIPQVVKCEKGIGAAPTDPYVAFRKRTEKMQTRKNRKNDEASYGKMLKLRRELCRAGALIDMTAEREAEKSSLICIQATVFERRNALEDFDGTIIKEVMASRPQPIVVRPPLQNHQVTTLEPEVEQARWQRKNSANAKNKRNRGEIKERRPYRKKRKLTLAPVSTPNIQYNNTSDPFATIYSQEDHSSVGVSEDELLSQSEGDDDASVDGIYTFRRKPNVTYLAPKQPVPTDDTDPGWSNSAASGSRRYCLTTLSRPVTNCVGLARRRMGRGGRIWLDRITMPRLKEAEREDFLSDSNKWPHFHPMSPASMSESEDVEPEGRLSSSVVGKSQETPSAFFISAEVTDGRYAGSCSQLEVVIPAGLGSSSDTVLESNGITDDYYHSSSKFCVWSSAANGCAQVTLKSSESCSSSWSGAVSPADDSVSTGVLAPSYVNNSFSSSLAGSQAVKMAAPSSCILSPSSPATANSLSSRISLKNNSGIPSSDNGDSGTCKKSNHSSPAAATTPLFIQRPQHKGASLLDSVQICNHNILSNRNNSEPMLHSGPVSKVLTSWNNESSREDAAGAPFTNGPKPKRTKATPIVFSETENL